MGTVSVSINWTQGPSQNDLHFFASDSNGLILEAYVDPGSSEPAEDSAEVTEPSTLFFTVSCDGPEQDTPYRGRYFIP